MSEEVTNNADLNESKRSEIQEALLKHDKSFEYHHKEESFIDKCMLKIEREDRCCKCIPIHVAMVMMGLGCMLQSVIVIVKIISMFSVLTNAKLLWPFLRIIYTLPLLIGTYFFYKFLRYDTYENRKRLPCGTIGTLVFTVLDTIWDVTSHHLVNLRTASKATSKV